MDRGHAAGGQGQLPRHVRQPDQAARPRRARSLRVAAGHRRRRRGTRDGRGGGRRRRVRPRRHVANRAIPRHRVRRVRASRVRHRDAEAVVGGHAEEQPPRSSASTDADARARGSGAKPRELRRAEGASRGHARGHGRAIRVRHRHRGGQVRQPRGVWPPQAPRGRDGSRGCDLPERVGRRVVLPILRLARAKRQLHPPRHPRRPSRRRIPQEPAGGRREDRPDALRRARRRPRGHPRRRDGQGVRRRSRRLRQLVPRGGRPGHGSGARPRGVRRRRRRRLRRRNVRPVVLGAQGGDVARAPRGERRGEPRPGGGVRRLPGRPRREPGGAPDRPRAIGRRRLYPSRKPRKFERCRLPSPPRGHRDDRSRPGARSRRLRTRGFRRGTRVFAHALPQRRLGECSASPGQGRRPVSRASSLAGGWPPRPRRVHQRRRRRGIPLARGRRRGGRAPALVRGDRARRLGLRGG
mmetsp:Transcript_2611/g.10588  ORF Transcript_2611/g.10588 Transcript_2611/m.10588 type:complete len:467 (-) Transcript_2611:1669-3069(-)